MCDDGVPGRGLYLSLPNCLEVDSAAAKPSRGRQLLDHTGYQPLSREAMLTFTFPCLRCEQYTKREPLVKLYLLIVAIRISYCSFCTLSGFIFLLCRSCLTTCDTRSKFVRSVNLRC